MTIPQKSVLRAVVLVCALSAGAQMLPAPRTPSAAGKPAPDFTLADQSGKKFRLAENRGHRVLLVFYRGYW